MVSDLVFRIRVWLAALADGVRAHVRPAHVIAVSLASFLTVLVASGAGRYVELALFVQPAQALREQMALGEGLSDKLRVVLVDDRSLERLGRHPTLAEWRAIGDRLAETGVKRVLLLGFPSLKPELGELPTTPPAAAFHLAAVDTLGAKKSRSIAGTQLAEGLTIAAAGLGGEERRILTSPPIALAAVSGLGTLNFGDETSMPAGFVVARGRAVPNLALRAAASLRVEGERWADAAGPLPIDVTGTLHIDFVPTAAILKQAVPVTSFFDESFESLAPALADGVRKRFTGVDVVVLAPEAHTGARFVSTPFGKQPSYTSIVALVNGVVARRYPIEPVPPLLVLMALVVAAAGLAAFAGSRVSLGALGVLAGVWVIGGFFAMAYLAWILPVAQGVLILAMAMASRAFVAWRASVIDRGRYEHEMATGRLVQEIALKAPREGRWGDWEYNIVFQPYGALSGDWFQVFLPPVDEFEKAAVIVVGDVVGKGASAALTTSALIAIWRAHVRRWGTEPAAVVPLLTEWNRMLRDMFQGEQLTTLSLILLTADRAYTIACGAPPWQVVNTKSKTVRKIGHRPVNLVGLEEWRLPKLFELVPEEGDVLIAHTDGIMDGIQSRVRFQRAIARSELTMEAPPFTSIAAMAAKAGEGEVLADDVTLLMVRWRGTSASTKAA